MLLGYLDGVLIGLFGFQSSSRLQADQAEISPHLGVHVVKDVGLRQRVLRISEIAQLQKLHDAIYCNFIAFSV